METDISPTLTPPLDDAVYRSLAAQALSHVEAEVDRWLEAGIADIDTHRSGGLLELTFENGSKIILNTQPPLQELWLAARSGGFHYRYRDGQWLDTRNGMDFIAALSDCASAQAGRALNFDPIGL